MKRFLSIVAVAIMTCGMVFATGCSKAPKCKQALDSVLTAESFTVSVDDTSLYLRGTAQTKRMWKCALPI